MIYNVDCAYVYMDIHIAIKSTHDDIQFYLRKTLLISLLVSYFSIFFFQFCKLLYMCIRQIGNQKIRYAIHYLMTEFRFKFWFIINFG